MCDIQYLQHKKAKIIRDHLITYGITPLKDEERKQIAEIDLIMSWLQEKEDE